MFVLLDEQHAAYVVHKVVFTFGKKVMSGIGLASDVYYPLQQYVLSTRNVRYPLTVPRVVVDAPQLSVLSVVDIVFVDRFYLCQHGELARDNVAPHHSFGLDTALPDNLKYIEPGKVMYAAGNTLVILEVATMKRRVIFGLDGGGIGSFAVHPTRTLVAVGEKGSSPNIYVYEYPSFKIAKVSSCNNRRTSNNLRMQAHQTIEFQHVG